MPGSRRRQADADDDRRPSYVVAERRHGQRRRDLHGKVPTESERDRAADVAKTVEGVKNLLRVVPKAKGDAVDANDSAVKDRVERAFKANPSVAKSGVKVASVNKGVALLSGETDDIVLHLRAVETACSVKGVRHLSSEVKVKDKNQS